MKNSAIVLAFLALAFLQVSFLPPLISLPWLFPVVLAGSALFIPFGVGILSALLGGFILDVYSSSFFGFWMVLSFMIFLAARYLFQHYVRFPQQA